MNAEWEWVAYDTFRLQVPGGWLYRCQGTQQDPNGHVTESSYAMAFVPEVKTV